MIVCYISKFLFLFIIVERDKMIGLIDGNVVVEELWKCLVGFDFVLVDILLVGVVYYYVGFMVYSFLWMF